MPLSAVQRPAVELFVRRRCGLVSAPGLFLGHLRLPPTHFSSLSSRRLFQASL